MGLTGPGEVGFKANSALLHQLQAQISAGCVFRIDLMNRG